MSSVLLLIYDLWAKPFKDRSLFYIEIFNELCILASAYNLIIFTDFVESIDISYYAGFSLIAVLLLNVLVNTLLMIVKTFLKLRLAFRKILFKIKSWLSRRRKAKK